MILLLTGEDDFNSLAAVMLADCADGPVHRVGQADPGVGVVAPYLEGEALFAVELRGTCCSCSGRTVSWCR
jgi:hypothetical protein